MPYRIENKDSYGCSGFPVIKEDTNEVAGCYESLAVAMAHHAQMTWLEQPETQDENEPRFLWRYDYDESTDNLYKANDIVVFRGALYVYISNIPAVVPPILEDGSINSDFWSSFSPEGIGN